MTDEDRALCVERMALGPVRISADCFRVWARSDPQGLAKAKAERGGLIVRVPVERQVWPNRTMDGG